MPQIEAPDAAISSSPFRGKPSPYRGTPSPYSRGTSGRSARSSARRERPPPPPRQPEEEDDGPEVYPRRTSDSISSLDNMNMGLVSMDINSLPVPSSTSGVDDLNLKSFQLKSFLDNFDKQEPPEDPSTKKVVDFVDNYKKRRMMKYVKSLTEYILQNDRGAGRGPPDKHSKRGYIEDVKEAKSILRTLNKVKEELPHAVRKHRDMLKKLGGYAEKSQRLQKEKDELVATIERNSKAIPEEVRRVQNMYDKEAAAHENTKRQLAETKSFWAADLQDMGKENFDKLRNELKEAREDTMLAKVRVVVLRKLYRREREKNRKFKGDFKGAEMYKAAMADMEIQLSSQDADKKKIRAYGRRIRELEIRLEKQRKTIERMKKEAATRTASLAKSESRAARDVGNVGESTAPVLAGEISSFRVGDSVSKAVPVGGGSESKDTDSKDEESTDPWVLDSLETFKIESVKDRRYRLKLYKQSFVGSELVDFLSQHRNNPAPNDRKNAVEIARGLFEKGFFQHVTQDHGFEDRHLFYRFIGPHARLSGSGENLGESDPPMPRGLATITEGSNTSSSPKAKQRKRSIFERLRGIGHKEREPRLPRNTDLDAQNWSAEDQKKEKLAHQGSLLQIEGRMHADGYDFNASAPMLLTKKVSPDTSTTQLSNSTLDMSAVSNEEKEEDADVTPSAAAAAAAAAATAASLATAAPKSDGKKKEEKQKEKKVKEVKSKKPPPGAPPELSIDSVVESTAVIKTERSITRTSQSQMSEDSSSNSHSGVLSKVEHHLQHGHGAVQMEPSAPWLPTEALSPVTTVPRAPSAFTITSQSFNTRQQQPNTGAAGAPSASTLLVPQKSRSRIRPSPYSVDNPPPPPPKPSKSPRVSNPSSRYGGRTPPPPPPREEKGERTPLPTPLGRTAPPPPSRTNQPPTRQASTGERDASMSPPQPMPREVKSPRSKKPKKKKSKKHSSSPKGAGSKTSIASRARTSSGSAIANSLSDAILMRFPSPKELLSSSSPSHSSSNIKIDVGSPKSPQSISDAILMRFPSPKQQNTTSRSPKSPKKSPKRSSEARSRKQSSKKSPKSAKSPKKKDKKKRKQPKPLVVDTDNEQKQEKEQQQEQKQPQPQAQPVHSQESQPQPSPALPEREESTTPVAPPLRLETPNFVHAEVSMDSLAPQPPSPSASIDANAAAQIQHGQPAPSPPIPRPSTRDISEGLGRKRKERELEKKLGIAPERRSAAPRPPNDIPDDDDFEKGDSIGV
eukprot:CAMPEP_0197521952 /NCGR_PEP_ID=MMETSP1318-20131121/7158_1 /TAXON_ID=552666 /ORGANISM="Partenskyella glossopodia, Strain RCC365" /LENGTH=1246 /DNA_ID=CAMNT_0043074139 /DNA_START=70 /DNA_END=3810 /DNA_ORIENTATION=-